MLLITEALSNAIHGVNSSSLIVFSTEFKFHKINAVQEALFQDVFESKNARCVCVMWRHFAAAAI